MSRKASMNKRAFIPLIAVIPVVVLSIWILADEPAGTASDNNPATAGTRGEEAAESVAPARATGSEADQAPSTHRTPQSLGEKPFASSLAGTEIDGSLRADDNGNLIIDLETRDFFDYFLNTIGEVSPEKALDQIETLARDNLPEQAAEQALALLDQYLDYKDSALALGSQNLDPTRQSDPQYQLEMLKGALADMKQLRRNSFDASTHEAFFGLEEAYGDYTLASLDIQQRTDLSAESKATLQEWHRQQLPEVIRRTETRMIADGERIQQRQKALADTSSPEEAGRQLQALGVEPEQSAEVVGYLKEREQFDQRFDQYRQEVASLDQSGVAEEDRAAMESQLLEQHFEDEQSRTWARLRALESRSP
ncbi:lipase secretion chaperone [Marinobacter sp. HL-58]|uniref:lipase secretion chaperone n=1 Tax=Marinobacter sp. HL-58 TaxID=1479237 RepID=UPI0006D96185|nr:lipase secretion chaperone [Marinobacter sp. HL-58]KPQ02903.1 MAG: lipase chaperone [Marinobacter sp. HL-58]